MPSHRLLRVEHTTSYTYDHDVPRSVHAGHLQPVQDRRQRLIDYQFRVATEPHQPIDVVEFDDAFGNEAFRFDVQQPYRKLTVSARSTIELEDHDPFDFSFGETRPSVPVNWMPRERLALAHYLQPAELPDPQLQELFDYAMTFVDAANGDLVEALFAINLTLFREYEYVPGSTSNETTAFETLKSRRGVCQDFAGLMIMLARLIRVPARYVCGYVFTGNDAAEHRIGRAPSDASHAWVQLYLPNIGWKGFDPTNGVLPRMDHVRLAVGRNWRDTAPLTGTLFGEAQQESLEAGVSVTEVDPADV